MVWFGGFGVASSGWFARYLWARRVRLGNAYREWRGRVRRARRGPVHLGVVALVGPVRLGGLGNAALVWRAR